VHLVGFIIRRLWS